MPRRQREAESSRVMFRPAKVTWPARARSPEMRPNRLVLPAPFGPTIPTVSPAPTEKTEIFRDDDAAEPLRHVVDFKQCYMARVRYGESAGDARSESRVRCPNVKTAF